MTIQNVDQDEVGKFEAIARRWWDPASEFKPLHDINPLRMEYIAERVNLVGKRVLDVGCGGGILSESLAAAGATVVGIDAGESPITVAKLHQLESGYNIDYRHTTIESLAEESPEPFDVITCLEMLEHVPDPNSVITTCASLLAPSGNLFLSTINRNPKAYLLMVIGAEYVLNMLPRGTHDYEKFLKPSEISSALRSNGLALNDLTGMTYNPLNRTYHLGSDVDVNYLVHASKD